MESQHERAVLFADVTGSTSLYEKVGDQLAHARVSERLRGMEEATVAHGGRVVKRLGDGLMCSFPDASAALRAALAMQLAAADDTSEPALGMHVGCHWGAVIEADGDLFGDSVNVAARVASHARDGQILVTRELGDRVDGALRADVRCLGHVLVKGKREPLELLEVLWEPAADLTMIRESVAVTTSRVEIAWGDRARTFTDPPAPITLGRDPASDVVVHDREASRQHATIERRRDRFVLVDHSANGTWIAAADEAEWCLRRQELILRGHVRIALGRSTRDAEATVIDVRCD